MVFVLQQSLPEKVYINAISRSWADYPPHLVYVTGVVRLKFSNIWFEGMRRQDLLSSIAPSGIHASDDASNDASAAVHHGNVDGWWQDPSHRHIQLRQAVRYVSSIQVLHKT